MANKSSLHKLMAISYHVEMVIRRLYRNSFINKLIPKSKVRKNEIVTRPFKFDTIIKYLQKIGVKQGEILIVHSAYKPLKASGLSPDSIVDALLELVGTKGTLVMPVIRKYQASPSEKELLTANISDITFEYNVKESKVWTGIISKMLMNKEKAITSRFPLNTITALGPEASNMMKDELKEDLPAPNGLHSPWKYCTDKNAWVVSLGTDLAHSLTMIHTVEDVKKNNWPVKNWYRNVKFKIIDDDFQIEKTVLERHPRWGMLHFGERTLSKDLIRDKIIESVEIEGVLVESLKSKSLYEYLNDRNDKGYPYFWLRKHLK